MAGSRVLSSGPIAELTAGQDRVALRQVLGEMLAHPRLQRSRS
jgi:hypothetical protein